MSKQFFTHFPGEPPQERACQCLTGFELLHIVFVSGAKLSSYFAPT